VAVLGAALVGVPAHHHEAEVVMLAVAQQRKRADRDLDALEALEPADEQHQPAGAVADLPASLSAVEGLEGGQVDARRHDENTLGVSPIGSNQVVTFVRGGNDKQVRLLGDLAFHTYALRRLRARAARQSPVLDEAEGVRRMRPTGPHLWAQQAGDQRWGPVRSEEHTSELQSRGHLVCRLLLEKKKESFLFQLFISQSMLCKDICTDESD